MSGQITVGAPQREPHEVAEHALVPVPPELQPIFDTARARQDEISKNTKYTSSAKDELRREVEQRARLQFDAAFERLLARAQKPLDQPEGQARAQLRNDAPSFDMLASDGQRIAAGVKSMHEGNKLTAAAIKVQLIAMTSDIGEVARMFDEAEGREQERVMTAASIKADTLAREARQARPGILLNDPSLRIATDLRTRLSAFRKANPSAFERLQSIAAQRRQITAELERSRAVWFKVYGWSNKKGPQPAA